LSDLPASPAVFPVELSEDLFAVQQFAASRLLQAHGDLLANFVQGCLPRPLSLFEQPEYGADHLTRTLIPARAHSRGDKAFEFRREQDIHGCASCHGLWSPETAERVNRCGARAARVVSRRLISSPVHEMALETFEDVEGDRTDSGVFDEDGGGR